MATFLESLADGIQSRWCALSTDDIVLGGLIAAGTTGALPLLAVAGAVGAARKGSDQICNKSSSTPAYSPPPPPFLGGQCEGVSYNLYTVNVYVSVFDNSSRSIVRNRTIVGKLVSLTPVNAETGAGVNTTGVLSSGASFNVHNSLNAKPNTYELQTVTLTRIDGGSDDCGDVEPDIPELPEYDDVLPDIPFEDDNGNPVNFPDLPIKWFPPCVGIDGLKVPFEIESPLGRICGKVELKPDIKTGVRPKVDFDLCPSEKEILKEIQPEKIEEYFEVSAPIGGITEEFPESHYGGVPSFQADSEKPILGVFIKAGSDGSDDGRATEIYQTNQASNSPILVVPRMGSVRFYCLISKEEGNTHDWSLPIDIKQAKQFIPCPWSFGALAVDIQWEKGYSGVYSIAKRKSCCESCAEIDPNRLPENVDRCD